MSNSITLHTGLIDDYLANIEGWDGEQDFAMPNHLDGVVETDYPHMDWADLVAEAKPRLNQDEILVLETMRWSWCDAKPTCDSEDKLPDELGVETYIAYAKNRGLLEKIAHMDRTAIAKKLPGPQFDETDDLCRYLVAWKAVAAEAVATKSGLIYVIHC